MNREKKEQINYGFVISGVLGLYWAYKELTYKGDSNSLFYLKHMIQHPSEFTKENDGKLVYVTGSLRSNDISSIQDSLFSITVPGMKLRRKVEMYQWHNDKENYAPKWSEKPISSSGFLSGYENPKWKIFNYETTVTDDLKLGDYKITPKVIDQVKSWKEVIGNYKGTDLKQTEQFGKLILYRSKKKFVIPKIGNYRISHEYIPNGLYVSVIAQQKTGKLVPYKGIFIFKEGLVSSDKLIEEFGKNQTTNIWLTRVLCGFGISASLYYGSR